MKLRSKWIAILLLAGAAALAVWLFSVFYNLPKIESLSNNLYTPSIRITDRNGRLLYELLPEQGGRHAVLTFDEIPQCMKDATIANEPSTNFHEYTNSIASIRVFVASIRGRYASTTINLAL